VARKREGESSTGEAGRPEALISPVTAISDSLAPEFLKSPEDTGTSVAAAWRTWAEEAIDTLVGPSEEALGDAVAMD